MKRSFDVHSYKKEDIVLDGNRFLLGNGHLGYRGTLEEYGPNELTGLILAGVYDQFEDKWRENLALPNPFSFHTCVGEKEASVLTQEPIKHHVGLDIEDAVYQRESEFEGVILRSARFVSHDDDRLLGERYTVEATKDGDVSIAFGMEREIYEINGPHFQRKSYKRDDTCISFEGVTNEEKTLYVHAYFASETPFSPLDETHFVLKKSLKAGESITIDVFAFVDENKPSQHVVRGFEEFLKSSMDAFHKKKRNAEIHLIGDDEADFELNYSIYHLLILGDETRSRSISARGISGQTYKGAIFWDTEIFLLPFFVLTNPAVARNLLRYRIQTLEGAKAKAKSLGYEGAYYAWESQDSGLEACRSDNVTDPVTGEIVETFFGTKQIHISADIVYAFDNYIKATGDASILYEGGFDVLLEVAKFFLSYAKKENGFYRIDDVIGPDEYHERVNLEAFTSYMALYAIKTFIHYFDLYQNQRNEKTLQILDECRYAVTHWILPKANEKGIIPQFDGYLDLEDVDVETVRSRLKNPQDYWGGKYGVATPTQIIKQADVVCLLALLNGSFDLDTKRKNYDYYKQRTEHGSSLSASMHALLSCELGYLDDAYMFFRQTSCIDIKGATKQFAGGVYIGGTHPAANAGAYLCVVYGFLGLQQIGGKITLHPRLPKQIKEVTFRFHVKGKKYYGKASQDGAYTLEEEIES